MHAYINIYSCVLIYVANLVFFQEFKNLLREIRLTNEAKEQKSKWGVTANCTSIALQPSGRHLPFPSQYHWEIFRGGGKETSFRSPTFLDSLFPVFIHPVSVAFSVLTAPCSNPRPHESFPGYQIISVLRSLSLSHSLTPSLSHCPFLSLC